MARGENSRIIEILVLMEVHKMNAEQVKRVLDALEGLYPEAKAELHFTNPF